MEEASRPVAAAEVSTWPFVSKRVFSFFGLVPIGIYVVVHLLHNNYSNYGPEIFNQKLNEGRGWPFYYLFTILFLYVPIFYHIYYGVTLMFKGGNPQIGRNPYFRNLTYILQRLSGIGIALFLPAHILKAKYLPMIEGQAVDYAYLVQNYSNPLTVGVYILGILGVAYHLGNGVWGATVTWGVAIGPRSQKFVQVLSIFIALFVAILGYSALYGFMKAS